MPLIAPLAQRVYIYCRIGTVRYDIGLIRTAFPRMLLLSCISPTQRNTYRNAKLGTQRYKKERERERKEKLESKAAKLIFVVYTNALKQSRII